MNDHLPLHRLFFQLENSGIFVGTAERLRVQHLLAASGGAWLSAAGREDLMFEIAPLICRNRVEQEVFYKVFLDFLRGLEGELPTVVAPPRLGFFQKYWRLLAWVLGLAGLTAGVWLNWDSIFPPKKIEVKFEEINGKTEFKTNETAVFKNTTDPKLRQGVSFVWKVYGDIQNLPILIDSSEVIQFKIDRLNAWQSFRILLYAHRISGEYLRGEYDDYEIHCLSNPLLQDSTIRTKGNYQLNQKIQFFAPTGLDKKWKTDWHFDDGETSSQLNPKHIFENKGIFNVQLVITDTTQRGQCSAILEKQIQIESPDPTLQPQTLQKDTLKKYWAYTKFTWLLATAALLAAILFFWKWWNRPSKTHPLPAPNISQNLRRAFEPKDRAPYAIPYRSNNAQIRLAAEQMELANTLRRRQEGQRASLHIPRSIGATIENLGFPALRFAQNSRPTHYLFLIDLQAGASHQAQLFQYLVEILVGQEVLADVFFYKNDLSRFWNPLHPEGLSLEQVAMQFGDRRLVVFGDGDRLVSDAPEGLPLHKNWAETLQTWQQRMLVTPTPVASWTFREARLYRVFAVFHADLSGLMQAAQFVDAGMDDENLPPTFAEWERRCRAARIDADTERSWRTPADHREYLREARSEQPIYRWLRALAVYPDLNWNVTIAIGRALGIEPRYEHLLVLARIPWLQAGAMKHSLWRAFWQELPKEDERLAREAIRTELQVIEAKAAEGYADQKVQIRLAVQGFALAPDDPDAQDAMRFVLSQITPSPILGEELDFVVARHLPDFQKVAGEAGSTAAAFLKQEVVVSRPFFTRHFWLGLACLPFFLLPVLVPAERWADFYHNNIGVARWFVEEREAAADEAVRLNNLAVDASQDSIFNAKNYPEATKTDVFPFVRESVEGNLLGLALKQNLFYELARANYARVFYNVGLRCVENQQKNLGFIYLKEAYNFSDSLKSLAAEALALAFYKTEQIDSACLWIKKVVESKPDYFNWLAAKGLCGQDTFALRLLVLDEKNSQPIANAELRSPTLPVLKTGRNGRLSFDFPPKNVPSRVQLAISKNGFVAFSGSLVPSLAGRVDTIWMIGDGDGDGVPDKLDKCPNEKGTLENGCPPKPDRDGDGVPDENDACPDEKGDLPNGCLSKVTAADRDGDGVPDEKDLCPDEKGTLENGCLPKIAAADRDGDGLPDEKDKCPDVMGAPNFDGCPTEEQLSSFSFYPYLDNTEGIVEHFRNGKIDWTNNFIEASGTSFFNSKFNDATQRVELAKRAALLIAKANLLELVKTIMANRGQPWIEQFEVWNTKSLPIREVENSISGIRQFGAAELDKDGATVKVRYNINGSKMASVLVDFLTKARSPLNDSKDNSQNIPNENTKQVVLNLVSLPNKQFIPEVFPVVVDEKNDMVVEFSSFYKKYNNVVKFARLSYVLSSTGNKWKDDKLIFDATQNSDGSIKIGTAQAADFRRAIEESWKLGNFKLCLIF